MSKRKLIAGNWKMNGDLANNQALVGQLLAGVGQPACEVAVFPPSAYLGQLQALLAGLEGKRQRLGPLLVATATRPSGQSCC